MGFQNIKILLNSVNKYAKIYLILYASPENFMTVNTLVSIDTKRGICDESLFFNHHLTRYNSS